MRSRWAHLGLTLAGGLVGYAWSQREAAARGHARYAALARGEVSAPRVVVVGAGFAGLAAAVELGRAGIQGEKLVPVLVDRNNFHLFTPLLYQVATGGVEPGHITYPTRFVAADCGFLFRESELLGVDLLRRRLVLDDGELSYDHLILALGSVPNFFGLADVARHVLPLKWTGDAVEIHNRIVGAFEGAEVEPDPLRRRELLTFVVVGGGATGVELTFSLNDFIHPTLMRQYPTLRREEVRLVLVEGRGQLLPGIDPRMSAIALRQLRERGVEVMLESVVAGASEGSLRTRDGREVRAGTIVWAAGVRAPTLAEQIPAPRARDGRLQVNQYLELPEHPDVYAAGDLAYCLDPATGRPLPANAPVAIQEGRAAAANVLRRIRQQPPQPFVYRPIGDLVSLGRTRAVADLAGVVFDGLPAWVVRRTVYLLNLVGFKNKAEVLLDWSADFFYRRNAARMEYGRQAAWLPLSGQAGPPRRREPPEEQRPAA